MTEAAWQPGAGDLVWTDLNPTQDSEPTNRQPALVVSPKLFTANTGLALVCPITSRVLPLPSSVILPPGLPVSGEILISHIRSIDTRIRRVIYAGASIAPPLADEVRAKLAAFIVI